MAFSPLLSFWLRLRRGDALLTERAGAALDILGNLELKSGTLIFSVEAGYFAVNINQPCQVELQKVMGLRAVRE